MNREKDIAQIRKYLNGELNARAMHDLERRALDDPFLADAMEGFEQAGNDQQANLDDLSGRLQQRTTKKERRIIPWMPLSIAASVLVVIGAAIWFFTSNQSAPPKQLVENIKPEQKKVAVPDTAPPATEIAIGKADNEVKAEPAQKAYQKRSVDKAERMAAVTEANSSPALAEPAPASVDDQAVQLYKPKKDSIKASEMIVKDMSQKKQPDQVAMGEVAVAKAKQPAATETVLQSRADGVSVTPAEGRTLTGIVMGSDGLPITGATVKVMGRPFGAVTDAKGKFSLPDVSKDQTLAVNFIGYSGKKVKVDNQDSISINLEPNNSSLAEVVVTGYSTKKEDSDVTFEDAHPKNGWSSFNNYLKANAKSPDGKTGKVKLSFIVAADGSLGQFKITKSLSDIADKKAIDIVTNGPAWVGASDGKPKVVRVTVNFK